MNKLSIIIPVLNEASNIKKLLHHLIENAFNANDLEIIISDGGSSDGTLNKISSFRPHKFLKPVRSNGSKIKLIHSEKGRPKQMNTGAKHATGNVLYFLHADSYPPKYFDQFIVEAVEKDKPAGCFRMRFDSDHWWLKLAGWLTALPFRACRGGDQSQFITRKLFNDIGGYDENFTIYEDNDLIKKLYQKKQFVVIPKWLTTSARCYRKHGIWKTQYHFWRIHLKNRMGASAQELICYYKENLVNA
ncbi:TIGR04283 family arsenosugar biosynthesis glycosyltransferase [Hyunsoonleella sp. SJ7]|uniref:TIGR04283 family arsenosugar biosynthesis glycosyltransferase n=1 Tax=Hyunsoonleella aquatilis TaxID=2762758 RepID=A0A923KJA3_9FLAO|nr:TIGR04283 family arsenosugar biosynthesis glycosyltransferase [Hyunsoonleella aquatilis]MBC3757117.1 TIGR04283 family arsenosugar biosynthesis glycosyltransferase [Hyunsoonleella aquatilis]